ncbi:hypothetical protein [Streptomyces sp. NBC_00829]|uniref:hypothetical protein n=1 Tax=Streptomyces sp. NBC_00829 TaxID=2903679 RepID=UPI00386BF25A|nr:hypothetical protein OG293_16165 [Streptomyces sp. NBC_00829]
MLDLQARATPVRGLNRSPGSARSRWFACPVKAGAVVVRDLEDHALIDRHTKTLRDVTADTLLSVDICLIVVVDV